MVSEWVGGLLARCALMPLLCLAAAAAAAHTCNDRLQILGTRSSTDSDDIESWISEKSSTCVREREGKTVMWVREWSWVLLLR